MQSLQSKKAESLFEQAQQKFEQNQNDEANILFEQAHQLDPQNHEILCSYGNFLHQEEQFDKAREILYKAVQLKPDENHKKYMQLGELLNGNNAIQCYEKGITIIEKKILIAKSNISIFVDQEEEDDELNKDLALGYCALAEIYQTDFLDQKQSEQRCKDNILKALEIDPLCLDAYYQFANFFLNKEESLNAAKMLKHIVDEIKVQNQQDTIFENSKDIVPYQFRVQVSKLLLEVEEFEDALYLLNTLYDEDNSFLDAIYMLAFVNFKLKNYSQVNDLLKELENQDFKEDQELYTAYEELLNEFKQIQWIEDEEINQQDADEENMGEDWMDIE